MTGKAKMFSSGTSDQAYHGVVRRAGLPRRTAEDSVATDLAVACFEADDGDSGLSNKTIVVLLIGKPLG